MAGREWRGESEVGNGNTLRTRLSIVSLMGHMSVHLGRVSWYDPWRGFLHFQCDLV
jgi:hypothetical protein